MLSVRLYVKYGYFITHKNLDFLYELTEVLNLEYILT